MKDKIGIYYYPFPENKRMRMYVREKDGGIEFRLRNEDDPSVWTDHGWVPFEAIQQARVLYGQRKGFDPNRAYDIQVAQMLIQESS